MIFQEKKSFIDELVVSIVVLFLQHFVRSCKLSGPLFHPSHRATIPAPTVGEMLLYSRDWTDIMSHLQSDILKGTSYNQIYCLLNSKCRVFQTILGLHSLGLSFIRDCSSKAI
jgi:hypothetical protein